MKQVQCPILAAIDGLRVGGVYDSEDDEFVVATGGSDSVDVIYAEANYRLSLARLEFARFEAGFPILPLAIAWIDAQYGWLYGKTYTDVYHEVIDSTIKPAIISDQLAKIYSAKDALERYCAEVVEKGAAREVCIAGGLPQYEVEQLVRYPKVLRALNVELITYCKRFSVSGVAKCEFIAGISPPEIPAEIDGFPAGKKVAKKKTPKSSEEALIFARELAGQYEEILTYVAKVEEYQRKVIESHTACLSMLLAASGSAVSCTL